MVWAAAVASHRRTAAGEMVAHMWGGRRGRLSHAVALLALATSARAVAVSSAAAATGDHGDIIIRPGSPSLLAKFENIMSTRGWGKAWDLEMERALMALEAPPLLSRETTPKAKIEDATRRRRLQQPPSADWDRALAELVVDKRGGVAGGSCNDELAVNHGAQATHCSYDCNTLENFYFPNATFGESPRPRCFVYDAIKQQWPAELLQQISTRLDWHTYVPATAISSGAPLRFNVGAGKVCHNVTIQTLVMTPSSNHSISTHNETRCLADGQHVLNHTVLNHTVNGSHSIEVVGYSTSALVTGLGAQFSFVKGQCTDALIRVNTTSAGHAMTWELDDGAQYGPWSFNSPASPGVHEYTTCLYDNNFTLRQLTTVGLGWQGTVAVVSYVSETTLRIPNQEKWILQGHSTDGVPVTLPARLSSGSYDDLSNASIVMRHLRISGQAGTLDPDAFRRDYSVGDRLGGSFFYEGGKGSMLYWDHVVTDHCGAEFASGGAVHIAGRGEERPGQSVDAGINITIRHSLFWANAGRLGGVLHSLFVNRVIIASSCTPAHVWSNHPS
jgi:hypothetical protein